MIPKSIQGCFINETNMIPKSIQGCF
jgi:hypothetical protein